MARQFINVSGETRALQNSHGVWKPVEDGEVYEVDPADEREYPAGTWEALPAARTTKTKAARAAQDEEAS